MKWNEGGQFENAPAGSHLARCYAVVDLGSQPHSWGEKSWTSRDVRISFELADTMMKSGKPFTAHLTVKQSLHASAKLRKYIEGWRGKRFDATSIEAFDPAKLIGQCCRLALVESESGYVNIDSIAPATKKEIDGMPQATTEPLFFSLAPEEFDKKNFLRLSEKTQEKIKSTPEWRYLHNGKAAGFDPKEDADLVTEKDDEVPF